MRKNYYQVLGLDENASLEDIKKAYKKYAVKFHPDKNNGDEFFTERFQEVQEAYEYLCKHYGNANEEYYKEEVEEEDEYCEEEGQTYHAREILIGIGRLLLMILVCVGIYFAIGSLTVKGLSLFSSVETVEGFYQRAFFSKLFACLIIIFIIEKVNDISNLMAEVSIVTLGIMAFIVGYFKYSTRLALITFPDSITEIDEYAFARCGSLAFVDLRFELTWVKKGPFAR